MHSTPAPISWLRWLRWGRAVVFGVILAALQLLLLSQSENIQNWAASAWPVWGLGTLFYLLVPAIEGCLAAREKEDTASGVGAGCLVGGASFIVLAILAAIALIELFSTPPPVCPPDCPRVFLPPSYFAALIIFFGFLLTGLGGAVGGVLGGWIGGRIGQRLAQRSSETAGSRIPQQGRARNPLA